ncbi:MAG: hypothetical protein ACYTKD_21685 [Planctomycetota bacterium]|jgi:hypothetical protein
MKKHWPYGIGNHLATFGALALACAVCSVLILVGTATWVQIYSKTLLFDLAFADAARSWSVVAFVLLGMVGAAFAAFPPDRLRLVLPTPLQVPGILDHVAPLSSRLLVYLPLAVGFVAACFLSFEHGAAARIAVGFFYWMAARAIMPAIVLLGVALRRLLVPFGYMLLLAATIVIVVGAVALQPIPGLKHIFADFLPGWAYIPGGLILIAVGGVVRDTSKALMAKMIRRQELVELAFPVAATRRFARRRMLLEILPARRWLHRMGFLCQEATGFIRPREWVTALAVLGVVIAAALAVFEGEAGSFVPMATGWVAVAGMIAWCFVKRVRFDEGRFHLQKSMFALPIGWRSLLFAHMTLATAVYIAAGLAALAATRSTWILLPDPGHIPPAYTSAPTLFSLRLANLAQGWLPMLVVLAGATLMEETDRIPARKGGRLSRLWLPSWLGGAMMVVVAMTAMGGLSLASSVKVEMVSVHSYAASGLLQRINNIISVPEAAGLNAPKLIVSKSPDSLWLFRALGLSLMLLPACFSAWCVARVGKGRVHPSYRLATRTNQGVQPGVAGAKG